MIGIYKITNLTNGKVYVGQSIHIEQRFKEHEYSLCNNRHDNRYLQAAWNKYGKASFMFEVIEECRVDELDARETYWKQYHDPNTYNLGNTKGKGTTSAETRHKIGLAFKGDKNPSKRPEVRKKISDKQLGHAVSIEARHKISKSLIGTKHPPRSSTHIQHLRESSPNKRKVSQLSKDGQLIKVWDCVNDAARFYKISQANISDCCLGKQKTAKGFIWSYAN